MSAANGPTKVEKYGYVYDGSSDWTIGENPDPQAHPMANVWSKNDVAALERCKIIADAFNVYAETGLTPREMMEERGRE